MKVQSILEPAVVETAGEERGYKPRVNWKVVGICVGMLTVLTLSYLYQRHLQRQAAQAQVMKVYEGRLGRARSDYKVWLEHIEAVMLKASDTGATKAALATPWLAFLRGKQGLFLHTARVAPQHQNGETEQASALLSCAGIEATPLASVVSRGMFLEPKWFKRRYMPDDVMKLRVLEDEMKRHAQNDLPELKKAWGASWFLLVQDTANAKVKKVSIWDLQKESVLFSAELEAQGAALPLRYREGARELKRSSDGQENQKYLDDCALGRTVIEALEK